MINGENNTSGFSPVLKKPLVVEVIIIFPAAATQSFERNN
jgi:hypothetical protein